MKRIVTIFTIFAFSLLIKAGDTLVYTLDQCVDLALNNNLVLKQQANRESKAKIDFEQSIWNLAPSVSGRSNGSLDLRRSTNQNNQITSGTSYNIGYGLSASLNIFSGFTAINQVASQRFNSLALKAATDQSKNNLYIDVLSSYLSCLLQKEIMAISTQKVALSILQQERIKVLVDNGLKDQSALLEIVAFVSSNKLGLLRSQNGYKLQMIKLGQLLEFSENKEFDIYDLELMMSEPKKNSFTVDEVYVAACENYPAIREKEHLLNIYRTIKKIRAGNMAPNLSLYGGYNSSFYSTDTLKNGQHSPLGDQFSKYLNPSLGISLGIPIFNGRSRFYQLKKSKLDVENAVLDLENERKLVRKEIEEALQRLDANYLEYQFAKENLQFAEKSYDMYREKFEMGLITSIDYNSAQAQWVEAKSAVISARYNWIVQEKTLEMYMGRLTEIGNRK